jgi:hypothetical protein
MVCCRLLRRLRRSLNAVSISLAFWVLYLVAVVFGLWSNWPAAGNVRPFGASLLVFVLIGLLGYAQFGAAIKG